LFSKKGRDMGLDMSSSEIKDFLSASNIARMATVNPDNTPQVTPVWYLWDNNELLISVGRESVKTRNIRKNNNVAVSIDRRLEKGSKGVIIHGKAKFDELSEDVRRKICQRYVREEDLDKYIEFARKNFDSTLLRIDPEKIISWDYTKDKFLGSIRSIVD
jgi:PPOX class probable F420-dependent enzyme